MTNDPLQQTLLGLKVLHQQYAAAGDHGNAHEIEMIWAAVLKLPGAAAANQALEGVSQPTDTTAVEKFPVAKQGLKCAGCGNGLSDYCPDCNRLWES